MSDDALWLQAAEDYERALDIAHAVWKRSKAITEYDMGVIQKSAATILIHIQKLRQEAPRIHVQVPAATGQSAPKPKPAVSSDAPSCPQCGGEMYDNREKKASGQFKPTSADFTCKDKQCKNEKGFRSGVWLPKANPRGAKGGAPVGVAPLHEKPGPLVDEADDDLPF